MQVAKIKPYGMAIAGDFSNISEVLDSLETTECLTYQYIGNTKYIIDTKTGYVYDVFIDDVSMLDELVQDGLCILPHSKILSCNVDDTSCEDTLRDMYYKAQNYIINNLGVITSPGQFEGEMFYAPYFYEEFCMSGLSIASTDSNDVIDLVELSCCEQHIVNLVNSIGDSRRAFKFVSIRQNSPGFIFVTFLTDKRATFLQAQEHADIYPHYK